MRARAAKRATQSTISLVPDWPDQECQKAMLDMSSADAIGGIPTPCRATESLLKLSANSER